MGKSTTYRQARLEREGSGQFLISWVTSPLAKVGRRVSVEGKDGVWRITEVYDGSQTEEQLAALRRTAEVLDGP